MTEFGAGSFALASGIEPQTRFHDLAAHLARALLSLLALKGRRRREGRVLTSHPRSAAQMVHAENRTAAYRWCRTHGLPCAMVGRLMPCSPGSRIPSGLPRLGESRRHRAGRRDCRIRQGLTVATTARTTRFCRTRVSLDPAGSDSLVHVAIEIPAGRTCQRRSSARRFGLTESNPPCPCLSCPTLPRPPQPGPRFERLANRPSSSGRAASIYAAIPNFGKVEYFCGKGLTGQRHSRSRRVGWRQLTHLFRFCVGRSGGLRYANPPYAVSRYGRVRNPCGFHRLLAADQVRGAVGDHHR